MKVRAQELGAGDWVVCPEGQAGGCWVGTKKTVGREIHFILGRGPGHIHSDVVMGIEDEVERLHVWPDTPVSVGRKP